MKNTKQIVDEDYEREYLKDIIYLLEKETENEQEYYEWYLLNKGITLEGFKINSNEITTNNNKNNTSKI